LVLLPVSALADGDPPPDAFTIDPAITAHVSAEGLEALGDSIAGVLPTGILATGLSGEFDCDEDEPGILEYAADDIQVNIATDEVLITPQDGSLRVNLLLTVWSDPAAITVDGPCVVTLDEDCVLGLPPTWLDVELLVELALQEGEIDAQVDHLWFTHGNFGNPVETGCLLGDALETMQGYGVDLLGGILDQVLDGQIAELETQIEEALGGLTGSLALSDELAILNSTLVYDLAATQLELSSTGLLLGFTSKFSTPEYGDCVPSSGPYLPEAHDPPPVTGLIPDTVVPYHVGIVVNEDVLNQALYAAWQGGVLCLAVSELTDFEITTSFLAVIDEAMIAELWPEEQVLDLRITPAGPPRVEFGDGPGLTAELFLDVYGSELDRDTRFWSNGLYADAGFGLDLEDGNLIIDLDFDMESHLGFTVAYNEWLPSDVPEGFAGLIPGLVSSIVDIQSMIPTIAIPALYGVTLSDLDMRVVGAEEDFLGIYGWIDPSTAEQIEIGPIELAGIGCGDSGEGGEIVIPGCEDGLGCDDESMGCGGEEGGGCGDCGGEEGGCGGEEGGCGEEGCDHGVRGLRVNGFTVLSILVPLLLVTRRRR
jgi:hypothetical protein